jgi:medium-chain acyl-[acyl-carrier-protein] hydrolase
MTSKPFVCAPRQDAAVRLFCLPYAGAGAVAYRTLSNQFPPVLDACAIELPGRGLRMREAYSTHLLTLASRLATELAPHLDRPFALMGYSMGSLLAFELARELRRLRLPTPIHLFVAAEGAPDLAADADRPRSELSDNELVEKLEARYGRGLPPAILADEDMLAFFVSIIRADLRLLESYRYHEAPPLSCPITVFVGARDASISRGNPAEWQRHTLAACDVHTFDQCGHFFLDDEALALASVILDRLNLRSPPARRDSRTDLEPND